jgi:hypothetical protein
MMPYEFDYFFNVMFMLVFAIVAVTFIVILVRGISEWNSNNHSPKLGVEATCVSKRTSVTHHSDPVAGDISGAHGYTHSSNTTYYAAFEVESGDRMELKVSRNEYGMLVVGDSGRVSFQGTRYLGFERGLEEPDETVI